MLSGSSKNQEAPETGVLDGLLSLWFGRKTMGRVLARDSRDQASPLTVYLVLVLNLDLNNDFFLFEESQHPREYLVNTMRSIEIDV